jgi:hypothetical protein
VFKLLKCDPIFDVNSRNCVKRTLRSPEFNEGFFTCGEMKLSLLDLGLVFPTIKKPYDIHTTTATITGKSISFYLNSLHLYPVIAPEKSSMISLHISVSVE